MTKSHAQISIHITTAEREQSARVLESLRAEVERRKQVRASILVPGDRTHATDTTKMQRDV